MTSTISIMPPRRQRKPVKAKSSQDTRQVDENSEGKGIDRLAPMPTALGTLDGIPTLSEADFRSLSLRVVDNGRIARNKYDNQQYEVSERDFVALNHALFGQYGSDVCRHINRIVVAIVGNNTVLIHAEILARSPVLYDIFNTATDWGLLNCVNFTGIGLQEFKLFVHSIYSTGRRDPSSLLAFKGVDYIKALCLSNTFCCQPEVYDFIADCTGHYFSAFTCWDTRFGLTGLGLFELHERCILEINEAYKTYKEHVRSDGPRAFTDNSFAILLWKFCPATAYDAHYTKLDQSLVREISNVALHWRDGYAFSREETRLFTKPNRSKI
ncbi:hypothetical protein EKO27_g5358 [Xylaria grammica]|uniref:BTB domain-containing protein n=1 Tax=Xylaria grammica TaxID=363999 RepID=A0A439D5V4_9PEZI|nr:hypothetical protein EKO27_g5358 [Xylaria grammica]